MNAVNEINLEAYSIEDLQKLVERAQKEIATKEKQRVQDVRIQMEQLASSVGLSVADVMGLDGKKRKGGKAAVTGAARPIKYRNPNNPDETWSGYGKRPGWLREALDQGANLSDFAV